MTLSLHHLQRPKYMKKKKRVGRGNASGHGTYSTRGIKGQKSRSGTSGLKRLGFKRILQETPKFKGQKRRNPKMEIVNLDILEEHFQAEDVVTPQKLLEKSLVSTLRHGVKILGRGSLSKKLHVTADAFSKKAKEAIEKAGGEIHYC